MKKILILAAILTLCGTVSGEEAKVFTEEDLKSYSKEPMSDTTKAQRDLQRWQLDKEMRWQEEERAKKEKKAEDYQRYLEAEHLKNEKDRVKAMEDLNNEIHMNRLNRMGRRGY